MIALLPLDNRPCNVRFPLQIARIGGDDLLTPPESLLGLFNTPAQPDALAAWLRDLPEVEALIVSIDLLAYGGLVASRRTFVDQPTALSRLQVLREWRAKRPETKIYAFNILMRLAITMDGDEAVANYYNIMRYARLADEAPRFGSEHLKAELQKVTEQIPAAALREYKVARARNHAVNKTMIDWLRDDTFDFLLITQEDATEWGLHRQEQEHLLRRATANGVGSKMSLHPGADEAALTLLARHWEAGVSFEVKWSNREDARRIAPFEDRPFEDALHQHIAAMKGRIVEADGDFELWVNAPVGGSQKDESPEDAGARARKLEPWLRELEASLQAEKSVALCDVGFPNGADNVLLELLEKRKLLSGLKVFGGWNTAGNTTGTVLAQCAALKRSAEFSALSTQFLFERLIDDWFYQSRVRVKIEKSAREQGLSPLKMDTGHEPVEAMARRELKGFAQILASRHFDARLEDLEISLPWKRTFEADVRAKLGERRA